MTDLGVFVVCFVVCFRLAIADSHTCGTSTSRYPNMLQHYMCSNLNRGQDIRANRTGRDPHETDPQEPHKPRPQIMSKPTMWHVPIYIYVRLWNRVHQFHSNRHNLINNLRSETMFHRP